MFCYWSQSLSNNLPVLCIHLNTSLCQQEACDAQACHAHTLREIEAVRKISSRYQEDIELLKKEVDMIQQLRKQQLIEVTNHSALIDLLICGLFCL